MLHTYNYMSLCVFVYVYVCVYVGMYIPTQPAKA